MYNFIFSQLKEPIWGYYCDDAFLLKAFFVEKIESVFTACGILATLTDILSGFEEKHGNWIGNRKEFKRQS